MLNKKGSVLVMTTAFILVFSLTGFGAMYLSGLQGQASQKHVATTEAFWAAEAGIHRALTHLSAVTLISDRLNGDPPSLNLPADDLSLESGNTYNVDVWHPSAIRWTIDSTGQAFPSTKKIRVEIGPADPTIIKTDTELYIGGNVNDKQPFPYEDWAIFDFETIFGTTRDVMKQKAIDQGHYFENPPNDFVPLGHTDIHGITWIECTPGNKLKIVTNDWHGTGILIVMGEFEMTGGTFTGVMWITGILRMAGNGAPVISGTIFVESASDQTRLTGTPMLEYNEEAVAAAFIDNGLTPGRNILSWEELL